MPESIPKTLTINGVRYDEAALSKLIETKEEINDTLIKKLLSFLQEWLDADPQITLKTSGTTGAPKWLRIDKEKMLQSARMTGQFFGLKPGMKALLCLSPEFIAGKMMVVRALFWELDLITTSLESNPLNKLNKSINLSAMVPLQVAHILRNQPEKFKLLQTLIIGGGALPAGIEEELQVVPTACWHTYAMTETLSHVALRAINGPNKSDWFTPMQGVEVSLDKRGCLVINAPAVADVPVVTNDLAELKGQKFKVLGRIDDVIISAGHKLHPAQIEKKLSRVIKTPFFLAGEDHSDAGQVLVLFLEGKFKEHKISELRIQFEVLLEEFEQPRKIKVIPRFKYLESGKIDRRGSLIQ
jgi:O-succinylbenzoic acid--CoA ligase